MRSTPMSRISRLLFCLVFCLGGAVFLSLLLPDSARAQTCFSNNDCAADRECRSGGGLFYVCRPIACNFNTDCPRNLRPCAGGVCQNLPAGGGGRAGLGFLSPESDRHAAAYSLVAASPRASRARRGCNAPTGAVG